VVETGGTVLELTVTVCAKAPVATSNNTQTNLLRI
jgi:hypothetical protein